MEKKNISFEYLRLSMSELEPKISELVNRVTEAAKGAYAPFSNFHVGAGVLFDSGEIVTATNQESEVFPSGICAERSLLYFVQSNYSDKKIVAMAITASPCGACRQVIVDTEKRNSDAIPIIIIDTEGVIFIDNAASLLPLKFSL